MDLDKRTPDNTVIVLIDYVTGFANTIGSQTIAENASGAVALAKIAKGYGVPLIVTLGPEGDPRGGLYPALAAVLGDDQPLVHRRGAFDSFDEPEFVEALESTGRKHIVIAGLMSEGCVLHTTLGAIRAGYGATLIVDATGGETQTTHDTAVTRMVMAGVVPATWLSFASELQGTYENLATLDIYRDLQASHSPKYSMLLSTVMTAYGAGMTAAAPAKA
jgi:nicotinamidase-related amidase